MTEVLLGGNAFRDCDTLISVARIPVLKVRGDPLHIELAVPILEPEAGGRLKFHMINRKIEGDPVVVRQSAIHGHDDELRLFHGHHLLLTASALSRETIHVHLDLRPLGLRVYSDAEGLHVGQHTVFNLAFQSESPAIAVTPDGMMDFGGAA